MLALLKTIDNARQEIPLAAVLVSPIGGFTMEELARLRMSVPDEDLFKRASTSRTSLRCV